MLTVNMEQISICFGSPVKVICGIMGIFYTISSLSSSSDCKCCFLLPNASIFLIRSLLGFLLFFFCRGLRDASWFHNCFAASFTVFTYLPVHTEHSSFPKLYHNQHNLILLCSFFIYLTSVMSHRLSGLQFKITQRYTALRRSVSVSHPFKVALLSVLKGRTAQPSGGSTAFWQEWNLIPFLIRCCLINLSLCNYSLCCSAEPLLQTWYDLLVNFQRTGLRSHTDGNKSSFLFLSGEWWCR